MKRLFPSEKLSVFRLQQSLHGWAGVCHLALEPEETGLLFHSEDEGSPCATPSPVISSNVLEERITFHCNFVNVVLSSHVLSVSQMSVRNRLNLSALSNLSRSLLDGEV